MNFADVRKKYHLTFCTQTFVTTKCILPVNVGGAAKHDFSTQEKFTVTPQVCWKKMKSLIVQCPCFLRRRVSRTLLLVSLDAISCKTGHKLGN